ncbi:MAG TPA: hypothetical protein VK369_15925, partial [Segetibacter sp.]|nr:hypothetical protein [Segetibacter sp.]
NDKSGLPTNQYFDLYDMMKNYVGSDDPSKMMSSGGSDMVNTFPVKKVSVPVDVKLVKQNGTVNLTDSVVSEVRFDIPKQMLMKNDLAVLNVIAAAKWKRPIYFTSAFDELGFGPYLRKDGLSYRLVPVRGQQINTDWMENRLMNKFGFGNANIPNVYFDEENRRHLNTIRTAYAELAFDLSGKGRKEEARKVLGRADKMMLQENFPYGMISRGNMHNRNSISFLEACYRSDDKALAARVLSSVRKDLQQQIKFYNSLDGNKAETMAYDKKTSEDFLQAVGSIEQMYSGKPATPKTEGNNSMVNPVVPRDKPDATSTDTNPAQ